MTYWNIFSRCSTVYVYIKNEYSGSAGALPFLTNSRGDTYLMSVPSQTYTLQRDTVPASMERAVRGDANPLDELGRLLHAAIFGQSRAIASIMRVLNRARYNFNAGESKRPLANLLFLGPTGVGKSDSAKRL